MKIDPIDYRLPKNLVPYYYDLTIQPYFKVNQKPEYYIGIVHIKFTCVNDTNRLVLHMKELKIKNTSLKLKSSTHAGYGQTSNFKWSHDEERDFFIAEFDQSKSFKANNNYTFSVEFKAHPKNDTIGFFQANILIHHKIQSKFKYKNLSSFLQSIIFTFHKMADEFAVGGS